MRLDAPPDWFWEGNVVDVLVGRLAEQGWAVESVADTQSKQTGVDIRATRNGETLLVEAKGYPSTAYRDSRRASEQKKTNPSLQSQHWFSDALLKALRLQNKHPEATVAMAFPDFPRYRTLYRETAPQLELLGIQVLFVSQEGTVETAVADSPGTNRKPKGKHSMTSIYIDYPVPHFSLRRDQRSEDRYRRAKENRRLVEFTPETFSAAIAPFVNGEVRFASEAALNDLWLDLDFGDYEFEEAIGRYIQRLLGKRYRPLAGAPWRD